MSRLGHHFQGQKLTCRGWGHIVVASRTVCWVWIRVPSNLCTGRYSVSLGLPQQGVAIAGIRNIRSQDYSFPGTFVPWTVRSMELSFPGTFVPGTLDLSCHGPFVHLSAEQYLVWNSVTNRSVRRPMTATVHSRYTQTVDQRYSATRLNWFSSSERG